MMSNKWYMLGYLMIGLTPIFSQSGPAIVSKFTWEGAFEGNKAVWKADDTLNLYKNVSGIDVTVRLIDSLKLNTTTKNPSEFNDWTKTNTFFRRGSLAFQLVSRGKMQGACLSFEFTSPVKLIKFPVWDIDMLQSADNPWSTYQDSVSFAAVNDTGAVALTLEPLTRTTKVIIRGQEVRANCIAGVNGDMAYNDPDGAVSVSSLVPLTRFTLCYSNGSEDDGLSNSHAIRMPEFEFSEILGSVSGFVREDKTNAPLAGSLVRLVDKDGNPVINRLGQLAEMTTGADGSYFFGYLPLGIYTVVQVDPKGYESVRDIDPINDNRISVKLNFLNYISEENNFFEKLASPLPVSLTSLAVRHLASDRYILEWATASEVNNDYYTIALSTDGTSFIKTGTVKSLNFLGSSYAYEFRGLPADLFYVRLSQTDLDGRTTDLGVVAVRQKNKSGEIRIFPNPAKDQVTLSIPLSDDTTAAGIYDICGRLIVSQQLPAGQTECRIDISGLPAGIYALRVNDPKYSKTETLVIR